MLGLLAGEPPAPDWKDAVARMSTQLKEGEEKIGMPGGTKEAGDRGQFIAKPTGCTHGGGRTEPSNISYNSEVIREVMEDIQSDDDFKKLAWFQSGMALLFFVPWAHPPFSKPELVRA